MAITKTVNIHADVYNEIVRRIKEAEMQTGMKLSFGRALNEMLAEHLGIPKDGMKFRARRSDSPLNEIEMPASLDANDWGLINILAHEPEAMWHDVLNRTDLTEEKKTLMLDKIKEKRDEQNNNTGE